MEMTSLKIVVEKHPDTYVAYPLGIKGSWSAKGIRMRPPWRI